MSVAPVSPENMKSVAGLATPWEFYWVLERPAPLAGMAYPKSSPWKTLANEGFKSVVCLTDGTTRYDPRPLKVLRAVRFKELYGGAYPDDAEAERAALRDIVVAARSELILGKGVVVHWPESEWQLQQVRRWPDP